MSIAVLYWTYSMGKVSNTEYQKSTTTSTNAVTERIGFEYVTYANGQVTASIINWGKTDNITIAHVIILDNRFDYVGSNTGGNVVLRNVDSGTTIAGNVLRTGSDATFTATMSGDILHNDLYYPRIVTSRGRNFDFAFTPTFTPTNTISCGALQNAGFEVGAAGRSHAGVQENLGPHSARRPRADAGSREVGVPQGAR